MTESDQIKDWKDNAKKIVFTNGCFDILHRGHVRYLSQAKALGDVLVVGLNSDASVKRLKGPSRPVNDQEARKEVLEALKAVDLVILFDDDTPIQVIENLAPNVLVKGGDYDIPKIVGYDFVIQHGGSVTTLPFVDGYSSSNVIQKMK